MTYPHPWAKDRGLMAPPIMEDVTFIGIETEEGDDGQTITHIHFKSDRYGQVQIVLTCTKMVFTYTVFDDRMAGMSFTYRGEYGDPEKDELVLTDE